MSTNEWDTKEQEPSWGDPAETTDDTTSNEWFAGESETSWADPAEEPETSWGTPEETDGTGGSVEWTTGTTTNEPDWGVSSEEASDAGWGSGEDFNAAPDLTRPDNLGYGVAAPAVPVEDTIHPPTYGEDQTILNDDSILTWDAQEDAGEYVEETADSIMSPGAADDADSFAYYAAGGAYGSSLAEGSVDAAGEKKLPKWVLFVVIGVVVLVAGVVGFLMLGNSDGDAGAATETPSPSLTLDIPQTSAAANDTEQFNEFADQLSQALTNHDAEAYYNLFSEQSKKDNQPTVAENAIKQLPAGATYKATPQEAHVAGPTATVSLKLEQDYRGTVTSSNMEAELMQESGSWKLVVKPSNTQ